MTKAKPRPEPAKIPAQFIGGPMDGDFEQFAGRRFEELLVPCWSTVGSGVDLKLAYEVAVYVFDGKALNFRGFAKKK